MKLNNYIEYILKNGIHLQMGQPVEIVCSWYLKDFIEILKNACLKFGASSIYIHHTDGPDLERKINVGYDLYIEQDIALYQTLIHHHFCRIHVQSPFLFPLITNKEKEYNYKKSLTRLQFVNEYFNKKLGQKTICLAANPYWAAKLRISEEKLWDIIYFYSLKKSKLEDIQKDLSFLHLTSLQFITYQGTNLEVGLTNNFVFQGRTQYTADGISYQPNIPCLELYTAPNKNKVNGILNSNKPLYYQGRVIPEYQLEFQNGKVVSSKGLEDILIKHKNLSYVGEIALVDSFNQENYYATLLNENTSCHLALGNAYPYGITELDKINHCPYHIDIPIGDESLTVTGKTSDGEYILIQQGRWVYET